MKTKLKDLLLYSLATIGIVALFISATQEISYTQTHGTPESHVWELHVVDGGDYSGRAFSINKVTGEVRKYHRKIKGNDTSKYIVMKEIQ